MISKKLPFLIIMLVIVIPVGCAKLPTDYDKTESYAMTDTQNTFLGRYVEPLKSKNKDESGFHLLANGLDAFVARGFLANSAQRSIDAQYYLYHQDLVGKMFCYFLLKAADRGVRIRLLLDDMDMSGRDEDAMVMDAHPNIEVRFFNPFSRDVSRIFQFITRFGSVTRRMHNKSFTVDNQVTILGGRNIGNEYFEAHPDLAFADLDVIGIGPVANKVSGIFDIYWNSELAYPVAALYKGKPLSAEEIETFRKNLNQYVEARKNSEYLKALQESRLAEDLRNGNIEIQWGTSEVVYDHPEKILRCLDDTQFHLAPTLKPYWENVEKELIIFSPYFVPGKQGTAFLTQLVNKGVQVKILTNSLASNDVGVVHAGYRKHRKELLRNGIQLYELDKALTRKQRKEKKNSDGSSKAMLHAKSFVFDRKHIFVGSLNLDARAVIHNTEIGVILNVPEMAKNMAEIFDQEINKASFRLELKTDPNGTEHVVWHGINKDGKPVVYTSEPYVGFWKRLGIGFLSLWPIESQL